MGTDKNLQAEYEDDAEEMARQLRRDQDAVRVAEREFHTTIVRAKDEVGFTFREIGEVTEIAHSWVHKIYRRRKKDQARRDVA